LRYSANYAAGKNAIINGAFDVWQRGTSITSIYAYTADRWQVYNDGTGAAVTTSRQTFTPGAAPVAGYEGSYFLQYNQTTAGTSATSNIIFTNLEDVRLFAGQTVTLSFWAKAASGTPILKPNMRQYFGSGGSAAVDAVGTNITISTSWTRYTQTFSIPSISGKTIGTNSYFQPAVNMPLNAVQTISFWGFQVEAGSVATAFQTATGTIQGELAACQRYYFRDVVGSFASFGTGYNSSTTQTNLFVAFPVSMRTAPTALEQTGTVGDYRIAAVAATTCTSVPALNNASPVGSSVQFTATGAGLTSGGAATAQATNATAYLGWSAEL
jgi:hypothetical protein